MAEQSELPDRISDLFNERTIFITGGSGFLGKVLIEKLLRCCPGIKQLYLLIRNKKGKSPNERLNDIFNNALFDILRQQQPNFSKKCEVIPGNVSELNLGITQDHRKKLQNEVDFIFHSAATTRFDDTLKTATIINTRGTKFMLELASECKKIKVFVHVSTAYVHPEEDILFEKIYKPPANPHNVLNSMNWIQEDENGLITKKLLGACPNSYTFTKALAEALVAEYLDKLPIIIVRPSIVIPVWKEPIPGWCNNLQGPMGLFVGAGKGIIRTMYMNSTSHADFIPADVAINAMIVSCWDYFNNKKQRVYNLTSSTEYNISWEEIIEKGKDVAINILPFNGIVWYPGGSLHKSKLIHNICFFLFQIIPAILIDALLIVLGYKPILCQIQRRIQKGGEMFEFYTTQAWNFDKEKFSDIRTRMNEKEKKMYKVDAEDFEIKQYLINCMYSLRRINLKETDDMIPAAKRNLKIMWVLDRAVKCLLIYMTGYYIYKLFQQ